MELKLVSVLVSMTIPDITGSNVRGLNIKIPHFGLHAEHNESGFFMQRQQIFPNCEKCEFCKSQEWCKQKDADGFLMQSLALLCVL